MKIMICDDVRKDAEDIREIVVRYLNNDSHEITIYTPSELEDCIQNKEFDFDIAIMDIYFEGDSNTGIDISGKINEAYPFCVIIYISGILEFAPEVYNTEHCYFVLKDNQEVMLPRALDKAISIKNQNIEKASIEISSNNKKEIILQKDIIYIERQRRATRIVTQTGEYICYLSLKQISANLVNVFSRPHSGFIVNMYKIKSMTKKNIMMTNGALIPIGVSNKDAFTNDYMNFVAERI